MAKRLTADEVRQRIEGNDAMLVCAYNDTEKCAQFGIDESTPYPELKSQLDSIPKSKELIFFCA